MPLSAQSEFWGYLVVYLKVRTPEPVIILSCKQLGKNCNQKVSNWEIQNVGELWGNRETNFKEICVYICPLDTKSIHWVLFTGTVLSSTIFCLLWAVISFTQLLIIPGKFALLLWEYVQLYAFLLWLSPFYLPEHYTPEDTLIKHSNLIFLRNHILCILKCPRKV